MSSIGAQGAPFDAADELLLDAETTQYIEVAKIFMPQKFTEDLQRLYLLRQRVAAIEEEHKGCKNSARKIARLFDPVSINQKRVLSNMGGFLLAQMGSTVRMRDELEYRLQQEWNSLGYTWVKCPPVGSSPAAVNPDDSDSSDDSASNASNNTSPGVQQAQQQQQQEQKPTQKSGYSPYRAWIWRAVRGR